MELSSHNISDKRFGSSFRGYKRDDVRVFLKVVAKHVSSLEEQLAIASTKAERAQRELDGINHVLEERLAEAKAARERIIEEAEREAASLRRGAEANDPAAARRAAAIVAEAESKAALRLKQVDRIVDDAQRKAEAILAAADQDAAMKLAEADRILDKAKRDAREFRRELTRRQTIGTTDLVIDLTDDAEVRRT